MLAQSWKMVGYNFVFFLAALQSIPRTVIEAGAMDGASVLRRMRDIQLPLIAPTLVLPDGDQHHRQLRRQLWHRRHHDSGRSGARHRPDGLQDLYRRFSRATTIRCAAAQSIVLMLLVIALTFIQFRFVERRIHYR